MTTNSEIWKTLSRVDVSKHIQKKGGLSYLPWATAWTMLMEHYPDAEYNILPEEALQDGSVMTSCTVKIGESSRTMFLPVMDYKNNAVLKPGARDVSDTRMRCLVKCIGLFGLGLNLYRGEDVNTLAEPAKVERINANQVSQVMAAIDATNTHMSKFLGAFGIKAVSDLTVSQFAVAARQLKAKAAKMEAAK